MTDVPAEYDIELAMDRYATEGGVEGWKAIEWLWKGLPWSARFMKLFGIAPDWWKRTYILPLLCRAAAPFLDRFTQPGAEYGEKARRWLLFFAPIAVADPQLFSPAVAVFLAEFRQPRVLERTEESAQRPACPRKTVVETEVRVSQRIVPLSSETKEAARGLVGQLTQLRGSVVELSEDAEKTFRRVFSIRREAQQAIADILAFKEELFSLLTALDDGLFHLSDLTFEARSDREAKAIVQKHGELASRVRGSLRSCESRGEDLRRCVDERRNALLARLHALVRSLDQLSLLDSTNPLYDRQSRIVRRAREQIKQFRLSIAKGPGPTLSLAELEEFVDKQIGVSEEFLTAGKVSFHQMADSL